jgi:hypothetical protein
METFARYRVSWSLALIGAFVVAVGIWAINDSDTAESATTTGKPATVEKIEGSDFSKVTLTERAAQRIELQTGAVTEAEVSGAARLTVPYGAIFYDSMGNAWVYTNPEGLSFVRAAVTIERIEGDVAVLTAGPEIGTKVVSQGAALLYGTEFGVGH